MAKGTKSGDKNQRDFKASEISTWDQKQDSFFKKIFLGSSIIRELIGQRLGIDPDDLAGKERFQDEYISSTVGAALHHRGPWRELRSDGIHRISDDLALGIEHQSSSTRGMRIRIHFYQTAFLENFPEFEQDKLKFVVVYSGEGEGSSVDKHLQTTKETVEYLYIDLNQISAEALEADGPHGLIMRLARMDATDISQFQFAADMVKSGARSETERNDLMTALVMASANKPELFSEVLERVTMNSAVRNNLAEALPRLKTMAAGIVLREQMTARAQRRNWPEDVLALIDLIEDDRLDMLQDRLFDAEKSGDWDALIEEAAEYKSGPLFK
jgi:hypothetical protein